LRLERKPVSVPEGQRVQIFVFDYDGTLTLHNTGTVPVSTQRVLKAASRTEGVILGIVSGRDLAYLRQVNKSLGGIFSFLVSENGAITEFGIEDELLIRGREWTQKARVVFADIDFHLRFFEIIAAGRRASLDEVEKVLKTRKLDSKLVFNRDSMMILPPNVDKGIGVSGAVSRFGSTREIHLTCFGDGENDIALFGPADVGVAVSDSVEPLKKIADYVASKPGGLGVEEYLTNKFLKVRI
jgi:hydroxymethylpyrimidine pyrophosphatase-like HAD family hydrolase